MVGRLTGNEKVWLKNLHDIIILPLSATCLVPFRSER